MSKIDWRKKIGWTEEQLTELRITGYSYIRQGKYDIALPLFQALTVLDPDSAYDFQTLGALYVELNEPRKALKHLDKALQIEPNHAPTLLNVTKALFMLGKVQDALRVAEILQQDPNPSIANIARALLLAYS